MSRFATGLCSVIAILSVGCGDDTPATMPDAARPDAAGPDAGPDAGPGPDGSPIRQPPARAAVSLLPCPAGWREVFGRDDVISCEPFPPEGREGLCFSPSAHLPGRPACEPIGAECPPTEFPQGLPPDAMVRFVRPGGSGDGSRAAPFGTVTEAIDSAAEGMVVALAAGEYDEPPAITKSIELRGVCAAEAIVRSDADTMVAVDGASVTLRDVRIGFGSQPGLIVGAGADVTLRGVEVRAVGSVGIAVGQGGNLTADGLVIEGVSSSGGRFGRGISVGFALRRTALCGAIVAADGALDLARGLIEDSEIGLCVAVPDYDFGRLDQDVSVRNVVRRIDSPALPVPDSEPPVAVSP